MSNTSNTLLGLFVGSIIGTGIGILIAPDKGVNTRKKIKDSALDAQHKVSDKISHLSEDLKHKAVDKRQNLEDQLETVVSNFSHKTDDVIESLEVKLKDLKLKNKKLQEL